jgi:hypothetical protein
VAHIEEPAGRSASTASESARVASDSEIAKGRVSIRVLIPARSAAIARSESISADSRRAACAEADGPA